MILVDANVFMYAAGTPHPNKVSSVAFLYNAARGNVKCCVNTEVLQEILHRYRFIDRWDEGREVYYLATRVIPVVEPVTREIMDKTAGLMDRYPKLMARDCLHAAHCVVSNLEGICSFDRDFDVVSEIARIEPPKQLGDHLPNG